jgi:uncharacterized protein (DUF433 family)
MTNETEDEIAGDKTAARRQSKTRQFYGFVGETNYNEAFIEELHRDWEESGYEGWDIPLQRDERIILDSEIAYGRPVIRGTRVPVAVILGALAGGMQIDETARVYGIDQEDVRAAIGYAARIVSQIAI